MNSFTSSFRRVVLRSPATREYVLVTVSLLLTLVMVGVVCDHWVSAKNLGFAKVRQGLDASTEVLIVGSSHFFGLTADITGLKSVNLSHPANSLEMMAITAESAIDTIDTSPVLVVEIGTLVAVNNPANLRDHAFVELGVPPWKLPGSGIHRLWRVLERYPPLRIPRLTPRNIVQMRNPELHASAQGFEVVQIGEYVENGDFRASNVLQQVAENQLERQRNLAALEQLLELAAKRGCAVIAIVTPHSPSFRERMDQPAESLRLRQIEICRGYGNVRVLDLFDSSLHGFTQEHFADSDHLNSAGHALLAEYLREAISKNDVAASGKK
jgi:hypothetical protein